MALRDATPAASAVAQEEATQWMLQQQEREKLYLREKERKQQQWEDELQKEMDFQKQQRDAMVSRGSHQSMNQISGRG